MDYRIIWSPEALSLLEHLVHSISYDNPAAAVKVGESIIEKVLLLSNFPRMGKIFREARRETLREIPAPPYRIFYEINDVKKQIEIISIWHGARQEPDIK
ncbi:MAG TPA: type II toxin-antitoxin system RelE/ParE family toxin [Verrucomicrobiae bacterium]|nr:type II toxin-antitoxin system RelE/ParE family toxin [Verrucomicrobiae bacterium]